MVSVDFFTVPTIRFQVLYVLLVLAHDRRRYRRRWKIERLFAWLQNFCRLVVRYERYAENFLGMLYLGCCLILLRHL
jgi:transposase